MATTSATPSLSFLSSSIFLNSYQSSKLFRPTSLKTLTKSNSHFQTLSIRSDLATTQPIPILSFTGEKIGETLLNLKSTPPETSRVIVHHGIITDLQKKWRGIASTLTRAEVRSGGRKPYPQKKTGRARRGSQRTPLRPGDGVIFGPEMHIRHTRLKCIPFYNRRRRVSSMNDDVSRRKKLHSLVDSTESTRSSTSSRCFVTLCKESRFNDLPITVLRREFRSRLANSFGQKP